jgi:hypothetical protein
VDVFDELVRAGLHVLRGLGPELAVPVVMTGAMTPLGA